MQIVKQTDGGYVVIEGDVRKSIPPDPANRDFQVIEEAIAGGAEYTIATPPVVEPMLTPEQWVYFLDLTGYGELMEAALNKMPRGPARAALRSAQQATTYRLPVLLAGVQMVRQMNLGLPIPTDEEIEEAFNDASRFEGLSSLLG